MKYRQLLILIFAIWAGQIAVPYAFNNVIPKKIDYETYTLEADDDGFDTLKLEAEMGAKGWEVIDVIPDPKNKNQVICFCKRQTIFKLDR